MVNFRTIAKKWQKKWADEHTFEVDPLSEKKKFFITFPYPYVNGYLHVGHTYTLMRCEALARYKRLRGFNVLFPQAWHATGSPIDSAAKRVKEGEEKQIAILKQMGFADEEIKDFEDPIHWIRTFKKAAEKDFKDFGMAIDWRRSFVTTDLNPYYSKFIQWQFNTLHKKGYVGQGEHPVVWCPKENTAVGDHARLEGEGEVAEKMVLIKFSCDGIILPAATFRPETTFGVTNMWLNQNLTYVEADVNGEKWLTTKETIRKLEDQKYTVKVLRETTGKEFIGKTCKNPVTEKDVPVLPADFVSAENGTGVVMSVPSHAPYDWMALQDVKANPEKFGIDAALAQGIEPISLIEVSGFGDHPAQEICQQFNIKDQNDEKLESATKEIYKKEFHTGKLKKITGKYFGITVQHAKDGIINDFVEEKKAAVLYDLARAVICRCLARCHVKIVDDQWFLKYSDPEWKKLTAKALAQCKLYPEKIRPQFENVIDWLNDWACTREFGLGTKLPWDAKWVVESLSDSTIYNAYYTIAHHVQDHTISKIDDALFDYVFLGEGQTENLKVEPHLAQQMKEEFEYWYPVDFRNSGKDLVQNHLMFYIFNHTAVFPEKHWPAGIGVNGFVNLENVKMSKSKGNVRFLRELVKEFTPDVTRISILATGEELVDVNWDGEFAENMKTKLESWYQFALDKHGDGDDDMREIDKWFESKLHQTIKEVTEAMDLTLYRTAIMKGFFELQRHVRWYTRRRLGGFNKELMKDFIEAQTKMLTPFTPHLCEEIWAALQKPTMIAVDDWPEADASKINTSVELQEDIINNIMEDVKSVLQLAKVDKPKKITLFIAEDWKHQFVDLIKKKLKDTRNPGDIIKAVMDTDLKEHGKAIPQMVNRFVKDPSKIPMSLGTQETELAVIDDAKDFFEKAYNCSVDVIVSQNSEEQKAKQALPGKPALLVE